MSKHKLLIAKIGANLTLSEANKSAANADFLYVLRTLDHSKFEVTVATGITRNTKIPSPLLLVDVKNENLNFNDYNSILIFNGSYNWFGGAEDLNLKGLYQKLANSSIPIHWVNTDGQLIMKQLEPLVKNRAWNEDYIDGKLYIDPRRVTYITQARKLFTIEQIIESNSNHIQTHKVVYFPFEQTIMSKHEKYFHKRIVPMKDRQWHMIYGGAPRNTYRRKRIELFYGSIPDAFDVKLFGNLKGLKVGNCWISGKVSYQQFVKETMEGKATIIIGDQMYEDNFHTLRMYESILAGTIVLIDNKFDSEHLFFNGDDRFDKCYVNSGKEAVQVLVDISKSHPTGLDGFAYDQYEFIKNKINVQKLTDNLTNILEN